MAAKFDMTAKNIKQATLDIVSNTCTERRADSPNAPKAYTLRPYCDKALVRHVKATIEVYDADAAADEQLAGNMIKGMKLDETLDANTSGQTFPGLKIVNEEKAHASRRLTSRGWACDMIIFSLDWLYTPTPGVPCSPAKTLNALNDEYYAEPTPMATKLEDQTLDADTFPWVMSATFSVTNPSQICHKPVTTFRHPSGSHKYMLFVQGWGQHCV